MSINEFSIHVENPAQQVALYDRIQVWKSATESGTYVDITSNEPAPAQINGSVAGPWTISGQTLNIALNMAAALPVTFTGSDPLSLASVLEQINDVIAGLAEEVPTDTGKIRLTSPISGRQSVLELSGAAAATLGLSTTKTNGTAARLLLSANTEEYLFRDYDGLSTDWYKTRYYSSVTGAVSAFSTPFMAGPGTALGSSHLVTAKIAIADSSGSPIVGRRIIFVPVAAQVKVEGDHNYGVLPSVDRIIMTTDANGRASITLVKGQRLKVFIEGTTFQREFVVPTTDFDVLTVASVEPDPLDIVTTPPMPIRVS